MEYKIDLLKLQEKSKPAIVIGSLFLLIAFLWIPIRFWEHQKPSVFDWLFASWFLVYGFYLLKSGMGAPLERFFGRAFIEITETQIICKPSITSKLQKTTWEAVLEIKQHASQFIVKTKHQQLLINFEKLGYLEVQKLKTVILSIASKKQISIT